MHPQMALGQLLQAASRRHVLGRRHVAGPLFSNSYPI
jgi:hypothetical protein